MQVLSQSAFLQALGYAIAGSLWQAALLWLVVAGVNGLFKLSSQVKYKIALAAQFSAFTWFLVSLQFYYSKCSEAIAFMKSSGLNSSNSFVFQSDNHSFSSVLLTAISKGEKLLPYLSVAYLCLLVVMAVRWIKGYRQTALIKTQGLQKIDVQWRLFVKRISELLNIKHTVNIYVSELVKSPLTVGFLKPLILIPFASINNLTTYQLEAVILHELAHIKRADYIVNIIQSIIEISLFFNPFMQLLGKIIKRERENSCDDWVLQFQYDPSTYAEALLRIAYMQQTPAFAMNAGGKETDLLWRVKRMLNQKEKTFQYRNRLFALLLITGLLSSVAWFTPGIKATVDKPVAKSQPVLVEPLAIRVDNPLFNPLSFLNKPFKEEVRQAAQDANIDLQEASKDMAGAAAANVAPQVFETVRTINSDLPAVLTQAGNTVSATLAQLGTNGFPKEIKQYVDSATIRNLYNNAAGQLKNIEWAKVNKGIAEAQKELAKELDGKDLKVLNLDLKQIINASLTEAQKSISYLQILKDDNGNDDAPAASSPNGAVTQKPAPPRTIQLMKVEQKYNEVKKKVDSVKRTYVVRAARSRKDKGDLSPDVDLQYYNNAANLYSYTTPAATTFVPAKFDQSSTNYSWTNGTGVSVGTTSKSTLVAVKEEKDDVDSYKKRLTIETMDSTGQRHTFHVTVEVYQ